MIDFILNPVFFTFREPTPRLESGGVDVHVRGWEKSSDHAPIWIELKK